MFIILIIKFNNINTHCPHPSVRHHNLTLTMFLIFLVNSALAVSDPGDLASVLRAEGDKIVHSIDELSQRCYQSQSQSQDNLEILTAVHNSLELQVITSYWECVLQRGPLDIEIISEEFIVMHASPALLCHKEPAQGLLGVAPCPERIYYRAPHYRFFPCMEPLILMP